MKELGTFENSPLRYPGGKSRRAIRLIRFSDQSRKHFVELFAGGLGMLFRARRERLFKTYSANDLNEKLINFYRVLRDHPTELLKELWSCYQTNGSGNEDLFLQSIEDLTSSNEIRRAVAFLVIDKWVVKGIHSPKMIRTATRRNGISPLMLDRLPLYSELLSGVTLSCVDFRQVEIPKSAFCYADPPYERVGTNFYEHRVDLQEFADWAKQMGCSWLISLNNSEHTNHLFKDYDRLVEPVNYPAIINPKFGSYRRRDATELVIMNYHRPTRNAFVRQFGWSIKPAKEHPTRCHKRAG